MRNRSRNKRRKTELVLGEQNDAKKRDHFDSLEHIKKQIKFASSSYGLNFYKRKLGR